MALLLESEWSPWNWGKGFKSAESRQKFWEEHEVYLILPVILYVCFVFAGPKYMAKHPLGPSALSRVKKACVYWNLSLSLFSCFGMFWLAPHLLRYLRGQGFFYTVCTPPIQWYAMGRTGFWMETFVMSKFPELLDTVFLVLQGKRVIFLHWYHHVTVLLFCLQAYIRDAAPGIWYASMNYSVHSIMYLYYAGMAIPSLRKLLSTFSVFITVAQILQMIMGTVVTMSAAWWWVQGRSCHLHQSTCVFGVIMYISYFGLFMLLFLDKYCSRCKRGTGPSKTNGVAKHSSNGEHHEESNGKVKKS